jgi:hypothetical protein
MTTRTTLVATLARAWSAVRRRQLLVGFSVFLVWTSGAVTIAQDGSANPAVTNSLGQRLQFIAAGSYIRGGKNLGPGGFFKDNVQYASADERPLHPVRLTKLLPSNRDPASSASILTNRKKIAARSLAFGRSLNSPGLRPVFNRLTITRSRASAGKTLRRSVDG